jgi:hypothetical protein
MVDQYLLGAYGTWYRRDIFLNSTRPDMLLKRSEIRKAFGIKIHLIFITQNSTTLNMRFSLTEAMREGQGGLDLS